MRKKFRCEKNTGAKKAMIEYTNKYCSNFLLSFHTYLEPDPEIIIQFNGQTSLLGCNSTTSLLGCNSTESLLGCNSTTSLLGCNSTTSLFEKNAFLLSHEFGRQRYSTQWLPQWKVAMRPLPLDYEVVFLLWDPLVVLICKTILWNSQYLFYSQKTL